jgi:hypothetical protein
MGAPILVFVSNRNGSDSFIKVLKVEYKNRIDFYFFDLKFSKGGINSWNGFEIFTLKLDVPILNLAWVSRPKNKIFKWYQ